jgi:hypothetical protein
MAPIETRQTPDDKTSDRGKLRMRGFPFSIRHAQTHAQNQKNQMTLRLKIFSAK